MTTAPTFSDTAVPDLDMAPIDLDGLDDGDPDDDPAGGGMTGYDPEAPFGRFSNGKPRKSPAGSRAKKPGGSRRPRGVPGAPRRITSAKRSAGPDYVASSDALIATAQGILGAAGMVAKSAALQLDTATLVVMGPQLAAVSGQLAEQNATWAGMLERISTQSKWAPALTVGVAVVAQLAVNHGLIPPGLMGTRAPGEMMEECDRILTERQLADQRAADKRARTAA